MIDLSVLDGGSNSPSKLRRTTRARRLVDSAACNPRARRTKTTRKRKTSWAYCLRTRATTTLCRRRDWKGKGKGQVSSDHRGRGHRVPGERCCRCWCEDADEEGTRRRDTPAQMRCRLIKASTDEQCRNMFCDLCVEKRYAFLHIQYIFLTF
ncbi:hypothetical protein EDB84DRAFT_1198692 [Lactarius hengduanensis]|nr:hypothetical protein EDB84DRAFT_1198692 [Lactarius hengduanensis]